MFKIFLIIAAVCITLSKCALNLVTRDEWNAKPPKIPPQYMPNPVPYVVIHHSYIPAACNTSLKCIAAMQSMQEMHQVTNDWNDIGYSFGVGGDGNTYEGRGWSSVGAHAPGYNTQSIGICTIGDWTSELPPNQQIEQIRELIAFGVKEGYIRDDYNLIGHRQAKLTECPGDRLFDEIQKWDHFTINPIADNRKYNGSEKIRGEIILLFGILMLALLF